MYNGFDLIEDGFAVTYTQNSKHNFPLTEIIIELHVQEKTFLCTFLGLSRSRRTSGPIEESIRMVVLIFRAD